MPNKLSKDRLMLDGARTGETVDLADIVINTGISVVIPTYKEADNIPIILDRIAELKVAYDIRLEVLFMDDDSRDGSEEAVAASGYPWARIIVRNKNKGLSPAVIDGFRAAQYPVLICMDCDLSHPPEMIPYMVLALSSGQQFVIGSRYVPGGSTDSNWGIFRWLNSFIATLLARPLVSAKDPMSGFFAMRKSDFEKSPKLSPVGYKIALELIVKCGFENIAEVPIQFTDRIHGESKLSLKEQLKYLQHLRRLYIFKSAEAMHFLQFLAVGMSGVVVNLAVLGSLSWLGLSDELSLAGGIAASVLSNFALNRRFTFSYARQGNVWRQLLGFVGASMLGMIVNYTVSLYLRTALFSELGTLHLYFAALGGIACGTIFNFLGNRFLVFRKRYVRPKT